MFKLANYINSCTRFSKIIINDREISILEPLRHSHVFMLQIDTKLLTGKVRFILCAPNGHITYRKEHNVHQIRIRFIHHLLIQTRDS